MPWISFALFGLAIAAWQLARYHPHDVSRSLYSLTIIACTLGGLLVAPPLLQGAILIGLLVYPARSPRLKAFTRLSCAGLCLSCDEPCQEPQTCRDRL